jgi:outer membrane protein OmpA-like peptidoglycan-associated protein
MADGVDKLKQLLFQQETATLADLEQRIARVAEAEQRARSQIAESLRQLEAIRQLGAESRRLQSEIERRLAGIDRVAGSPDALKESVAKVIDGVIEEARKTRQDDLSRALAPMLVKTIKAELRNNQAEMVQALYPITGQLVKSYVASAMRDLTNRMNRGIETSGFVLTMRSLLSGYSKAELRISETQRLEVEELYIVRRGSGELLVRFPETLGRPGTDVHHMTGVLAAINDFAANAFQADGGHLRNFDVDDFTLFLRASPAYLLAAKCRGVAAPGVESLIDGEFLATVPQLHELDTGSLGTRMPIQLLADLKGRIESGIADKHEELSRAGLPFRPLRAMAASIALLLLAGGGWFAWSAWEERQTRDAVQSVIAVSEQMRGFPVTFEVGPRGRSVALSGLAPSDAAKSNLLTAISAALPAGVVVGEKGFAVLPGPGQDLRPAISAVRNEIGSEVGTVRRDIGGVETALRRDLDRVQAALKREIGTLERQTLRAAAARSIERAQRRLEETLPDIATLAALQPPARRTAVTTLHRAVEAAAAGLTTQAKAIATSTPDAVQDGRISEALDTSIAQLRKAAADLSGLIGQRQPAEPALPAQRRSGGDVSDVAEAAALAAERLATVTAAALQVSSIRLPDPPQSLPQSPLERLKAYVSRHAIFFANGEDFRDGAAAARVIGELARLAQDAEAVIRVVGYTDERGGQARNSKLAQARAAKVASGLVAAGLPRGRIVVVGRPTGPELSSRVGPDSANRRVEFEVGFQEEPVTRQ